MTPSGHNWVQGQGSGPRLDAKGDDEEDKFDAMGNKIVVEKKKKLTGMFPPLFSYPFCTIHTNFFQALSSVRRRRSVLLAARRVRRSSLMRMISKSPNQEGKLAHGVYDMLMNFLTRRDKNIFQAVYT